MSYNKVIYDGDILIDLTNDIVTPSDVSYGKTFHLANGNVAVGTNIVYKDICFWDYDGTLIETWSLDELQSKTSMPTAPIHERLTFDGWNWSLENLKAQNTKMDVGALYKTKSGLSEFVVELNKGTGLKVTLKITGEHDWGDGTVDNTTAHTYTDYGEYLIKVAGSAITAGSSSGSAGLTAGVANYLKEVNWGKDIISLNSYALFKVTAQFVMSLHSGINEIKTGCFNSCYGLQHINLPNVVTALQGSVFANARGMHHISIGDALISFSSSKTFTDCWCLERICFPSTLTTLNSNVLDSCTGLAEVEISKCSVTALSTSFFLDCAKLRHIKLPSTITAVNATAFSGCSNVEYFDFTQLEAVPTLSDANAFTSVSSIIKVVVPDDLYDTWITKSVWSGASVVNRIIKESDFFN